jgi:glycosyltransferase involved in cell wall biosynthesis
MIVSYVTKRIEDGAWSGVPRFDASLRSVFSEMRSVTVLPRVDVTRLCSNRTEIVSTLGPDDAVITDNHLSLDVPENIRTVVVHHGCAATHFERDPAWQNDRTAHVVELQKEMFKLPNRTWVAPSSWVADQFSRVVPDRMREIYVLPHWAPPIEPLPKSGKPLIIGDWRDNNKGSSIWHDLAARCPNWIFRPISFQDDAGKRRQYGEASLYLCLSLSEGGSYSMCDAEAAELPVVSTDVGNYREFDDAGVIRWQERGNLDLVIDAIERKLTSGRQKPSFYHDYTFEIWKQSWKEIVQQRKDAFPVEHRFI